MPLINCPDCNHQVSGQTSTCPNCGFPIALENHSQSPTVQSFQNTKSEFLASYAKGIERSWELVSDTRRSIASRLVWYVAISGYVAINLKAYVVVIAGQSFQGWHLFFLVPPWIATAICALLTEYLLSIQTNRDSLYYTAKLASINVFRIVKANNAKEEDFLALFNEEDEYIKSLNENVNSISTWVERGEHITLLILIISFVWLLISPFCFL